MDLETKVLLLGILTKHNDESLNDVLIKLEDAGVFTLKDGKKYLKNLKSDGLIVDNKLSVTGNLRAKEIEKEFKI
ncbi:MAG: hypothetical protein ACNI3C_07355 [Candidatus Marinarcus sp.]|uniref:hypothetical protein n=1 Tax=Candidatus Marinarcus sp. TaxID=3100987 RepID=UPI003AFF6D2E